MLESMFQVSRDSRDDRESDRGIDGSRQPWCFGVRAQLSHTRLTSQLQIQSFGESFVFKKPVP
jgi:hypothetical protein